MDLNNYMPQTVIRFVRRYTRKLWVRVVIMGLLAFVSLGLTHLVEPLVPEKLARSMSGESADRLLDIIANAMLAVTTFSLTVMVTVYRSTSTQWSPRVHRLIIQDRTTQNTLAVFIGAYVYALFAIILRELGIYVDEHAFVLFLMTAVVLGIIVIYLVRWVLHLQSFGSLIDTTRQIEEVTRTQFVDRLHNPCLGANPLRGNVPKNAEPVLAEQSAYIDQIYPETLNKAARAHGVDVYLIANIGSFVFLNQPIAMVVSRGDPDGSETSHDDFADALRANIVMDDVRSYEQDPRFGLIAMGEIASKALSPGINDPGTAIDIIHRIGRVLSNYTSETKKERDDLLERLWVAPLDPADLLEDGLGAAGRDGEALIEVQLRLQHTLKGLMRHPDEGLAQAARDMACVALHRGLLGLNFGHDRERLRASADAELLARVEARMKTEGR